MKKLLFFLIISELIIASTDALGQSLGINNTGAAGHASSILDLSSDSKGLLIPRMTQAQRDAISSPATGLLIYQTDNTPGFYAYSGSSWLKFSNSSDISLNWTKENTLSSQAVNSDNQYISGRLGLGDYSSSLIGSKLEIQTNSLGVTIDETSGLSLINSTLAAAGAQQISPSIKWSGNGWKTTATAGSQPVEFAAYLLPIEGTTNPSANLIFASSINNGAYATRMTLTSAGSLTLNGGLSTSGAVTLNTSGTSTAAVTIGGTTGAQTIKVGADGTSGVKTVTLGSSGAAAHTTNINSGTSSGSVNINNNVNSATNINTGTSTGTITIGNSNNNINLPKMTASAILLTDASKNITSSTSLPVANGGTGLTGTPTNGQLPVGNGTGFTLANITAGSGISVTNGSGSITIATTGAAPTGSAGGDLSGTYPNPTVAKINGATLGSTTATSGNLLIANGTQWGSTVMSGDATISGTGSITLANSGVTANTYGSATTVPQLTVDAKGRITGVTNTTITGVAPSAGSTNYIQNQTADDQTAGFRINGNGIVGGNVGIGTTSPVDKLDVRNAMSVNEIKFRNVGGGDDSDPYRLRKVQNSSNNNELQLQLNDDSDERFAIYGNSCVANSCGDYSTTLYHYFRSDGAAFHQRMATTSNGSNYYTTGQTISTVYAFNPASLRTGANANAYQFGVHGHKGQDYSGSYYYDNRSGGVLGSTSGPSATSSWGSLGYYNSGATSYGLYYTSYSSGSGYLLQEGLTGVGSGGIGGVIGSWTKGMVLGSVSKGELAASLNFGNTYTYGKQVEMVQNGNAVTPAYSVSSAESQVFKSGKGQLNNGSTTINFDQNFMTLIASGEAPVVTVTPTGNCSGVYVENVTSRGFTVRELNNGSSSVNFNWIAVALRSDAQQSEIPKDLLDPKFSENMNDVMFDENNTERNGKPIWWDGSKLRFDPIPKSSSPKK